MHFSKEVYLWLLSMHVIPNTAEQDQKGIVTLPLNIAASFENGFAIADIIRKVAASNGQETPPSLSNIKAETSRSSKSTNWNFIWIALQSIDIKMDTRIKDLILQGEQALIVQLVRQLFERDEHKPDNNKSNIIIKQSVKNSKQKVDMKKLDLSKNPGDSQTSLQFLMLLLKTSLGMSVQETLALFTNQNKYLAQIIVKGVSDTFDPVVLFYTLLIKHSKKLKQFYQQDAKDAQACLNAVKPGLISKSQKVVGLTLDLFEKLGNIYSWFIGEGMCSTTLFLGVKRHPSLKKRLWKLLLDIISKEQIAFFTKHYGNSFQSAVQQIEISTILIQMVESSELKEQLVNIGIIANWVEVAESLREDDIEAQIIAFRFIGELMVFMPQFVQQNEDTMIIFQRQWFTRTLPEFATLLNQLIRILERLGEGHSVLASKIYQFLTNITKSIGPGDKRDYLVENFTPLVSKFTTIPTEYLVQHFKRMPLSHAEFLLVCESIQINKSPQTLISVGTHLKAMFLQNPLLNFYLSPLLKEIIQRVVKNEEQGPGFIMKLMDQAISMHSSLQIKYKSRAKHQSISFGKRDTSEKGSKQDQAQLRIKQKWKEIVLGLILSVLNVVMAQDADALKQYLKLKLLSSNNNIKASSFKVGCKAIQDALSKRFNISRQHLHQSFEQHSKKAAQMSDSMVRSVKPISHVTVASRIKGPQNLTKQFQQISEKRKQEEQQRRVQQLKKRAIEQKKRLSVKKQLQITNLLRGQIGEAQVREEGYLQRLMQEPKELEVILPSEIEQRQLQAIDITFKKYHKVLRHLFLTYTFTSYNGHANQKFEDNQQRKEILTVVELVRLLKDYKLAFLTSQSQISGIVRDINIKLIGKREVAQLDYSGFQQFIVQFCALIMTRNHTITTTSSQGNSVSSNNFKNEPLHVLVTEFFSYLKGVFITRREKTTLFDDAGESEISKEQIADVEDYTKKVQERPDYILPKGFKKVSENTIKFTNIISNNISSIPEAYSAVVEIIDEILSQKPFDFHVIESISERKTIVKVKPTTLGLQKERAMSTYIEKPITDKISAKRRSTSKGIVIGPPKSQRNFKPQVLATAQVPPLLKDAIEALQGISAQAAPKVQAINVVKDQAKQKRLQSMMKLQQLQKSKQQAAAKKAQQKEQKRQAQAEKQKEAQARRRQQTERFLQAQKLKIAEKRRKQEQQQQRKAEEEEEKEAAKRQNKERFKVFHQQQVGKIKKIEETALERIRKQRMQLEESKEQRQEQRRRLKSQIEEEDKRIIELRKETQKKIQTLYQSEPIRKVFAKFQPNLRGVFDFLLTNTYISLTEKKHNNQIVFETWRQFVSSFELTAFVLPKDTTLIFKSLTKGKLASKEFYIGLTFAEFQQALLRLCIKYRNIFNLISDKIKDEVNTGTKLPQGSSQGVKEKEKQHNQFEAINQGTIKDILKENASKDSVQEWGEVSQVTDKTLLGMIYYLKVPRSKQGQEKRFRQIIARPHPTFAHQADWLKEKLNEEYSLVEPPKKANNSKVMVENGESSQVSIK